MEWIFIFGFLSLALGLYLFFSKSAAEWQLSDAKPQNSEELKSNTTFNRYLYTPRIIFSGIMLALLWLVVLFRVDPNSVWVGFPFLVTGILFIVLGILIFFSKRFNDFVWRYVWHYDKKKERGWMVGTLIILGFGMLFCAYLFSGIFLYWP